jgi:hypothetical protein
VEDALARRDTEQFRVALQQTFTQLQEGACFHDAIHRGTSVTVHLERRDCAADITTLPSHVSQR